MNKKLDVKDFELQKVKFNAKKGLDIDWYDLNRTNDMYSVESDSKPSEDYINALDALKEVFAYSLGLNNGWDYSRENNRKNDDALKKSIQSWNDKIERCTVTGLTVVGVGETKVIKISGALKTDLGVIGMTSPIIRFNSEFVNSIDETIMIGDLAESAFNAIQTEIWMFIYKDKRGGELFSEVKQLEQSGLNNLKAV